MLSQSNVEIHDSNKHVRVIVTGFVDPDDVTSLTIVSLSQLKDTPKGLRLDSIVWLIEEKAGLRLYWGNKLIFPIESRNCLRLDTPLNCPSSDWSGDVVLWPAKAEPYPKAFFIDLDFDKQ